MNLTLRLLLPADWPTPEAACEWVLVNAQGAALQRGRSEPRHWPAAEGCEAILSAEQCLLLNAQLPKGARSRPAEVIAYALEDRLIGETEAEHFVLGHDRGADTPVWVIARSRMKALIAALDGLERSPQRIIGELQLAPLAADHWSVCLKSDNATGYARQGPEQGFAFDLADVRQAPLALKLALAAAAEPPRGIDVYSARSKADAFDAPTAAAWQASLGVTVRYAGEYAWHDARTEDARELRVGEFAPPRAAYAGWDSFKPALWLAVGALASYTLFSFGEWLWLERQSSQLRQQMVDSFRAAYPQAQNVIDAPLQMQRLTDQLRRARGQLGSTDCLPLLAAASEALGAQGRLQALGFEDGRLELTLLFSDQAAVERAQRALASRGLSATLRDTHAAGGSIQAVIALRGAS